MTCPMKRLLSLAWLAAIAALSFPQIAQAQHAQYDALVATHAKANAVPEALVHRVIVRESRYQPALVGRGGTIGLMQIKLATARSLGYTGSADGLRDPNTNLTYGGEVPRRRLPRCKRRPQPRHALLRQRVLRGRQAPAARACQAPRTRARRCAGERDGKRARRSQRTAGSRALSRCNPAKPALTPRRIGLH